MLVLLGSQGSIDPRMNATVAEDGDARYLRESGLAYLLHGMTRDFIAHRAADDAPPPTKQRTVEWFAARVAADRYGLHDVALLEALVANAEEMHPPLLLRALRDASPTDFRLAADGPAPKAAALLPATALLLNRRLGDESGAIDVAAYPLFAACAISGAAARYALENMRVAVPPPPKPASPTGEAAPEADAAEVAIAFHVNVVVELAAPEHGGDADVTVELLLRHVRRCMAETEWMLGAVPMASNGVIIDSPTYHLFVAGPARAAMLPAEFSRTVDLMARAIAAAGVSDSVTLVHASTDERVRGGHRCDGDVFLTAIDAARSFRPAGAGAVFVMPIAHPIADVHIGLLGGALNGQLQQHCGQLCAGAFLLAPAAAAPAKKGAAPAAEATTPAVTLCVRAPEHMAQFAGADEALLSAAARGWAGKLFDTPDVFDIAQPPAAVFTADALTDADMDELFLGAGVAGTASTATLVPPGMLFEVAVMVARRWRTPLAAATVVIPGGVDATRTGDAKHHAQRLSAVCQTVLAVTAPAAYRKVIEEPIELATATVGQAEQWSAAVAEIRRSKPAFPFDLSGL
jgi:hypothetical protein